MHPGTNTFRLAAFVAVTMAVLWCGCGAQAMAHTMIPKMIEEKKLAPFKNQTSEPLSTLSVAWMMWCNGATCNLTPLLSPPLHATTTHTHTTAWLTYAQQRLSLARHNIRFDSTLQKKKIVCFFFVSFFFVASCTTMWRLSLMNFFVFFCFCF